MRAPGTDHIDEPADHRLRIAAVASIGAGVIHAGAAGAHRATLGVAVAFGVIAALQLGWAAFGIGGRGRGVAASGVVVSAGAVAGWVLAKTVGIGAIAGLDEVEAVGWADGLAAALGATAAVLAARSLLAAVVPAATPSARPPSSRVLPMSVGVVAVVSLFALTTVTSHLHDHDRGPAVALTAFDPAEPVNLSGVFGVTPVEQQRAQDLVTDTLEDLPRYADPAVAARDGFVSMGDGVTGTEHLIDWSAVSDDAAADAEHPESLVYRTAPGREPTLIAAEYLLPIGTTVVDLPKLGGSLTTWTQRRDLCFGGSRSAPTGAGLAGAGGSCPEGLSPYGPMFSLHVWITPHPCGPFSDLEQVPDDGADADALCGSGHTGH